MTIQPPQRYGRPDGCYQDSERQLTDARAVWNGSGAEVAAHLAVVGQERSAAPGG